MSAILARDAVAGIRYRPARRTVVRTRYTVAARGTAARLVKRLAALVKLQTIRTDQMEELRAARAALAGEAILVLRTMRGKDDAGVRWSAKRYVALPLDYRLRPERTRSRAD